MKRPQKPSLLVFRIGSLGDTVVSLPAFHFIRDEHPGHRIVLLTNAPVDGGVKASSAYSILNGTGVIDDYIEYPIGRIDWKSLARVAGRIRSFRPELAYYLMPKRSTYQRSRDALFLAAAGLLRVHGLWGSGASEHRPSGDQGRYESEAQRLARSIGFDGRPLRLEHFSLRLSADEQQSADIALAALPKPLPLVSISIGTKAPAKDWGHDRWIEMLRQLKMLQAQIGLVFIGSGDEKERCQSMLQEWGGAGLNLCGRLSPRQSAAVMARTVLYAGHDNGPMHLASAVGTRVVALFAARTRPGIWFPFGDHNEVFYNQLDCYNCGLNVCVERQMACIRQIQPIEVARRIDLMLNSSLRAESR